MTQQIHIQNLSKKIVQGDNQTLLQATLDAGILLPYSCRGGNCGSCKAQLISGDYHYLSGQPSGISDQEVNTGKILLCQAVADSNLVIEANPIQSNSSSSVPEITTFPCRIKKLNLLADDVMEMTLSLPPNQSFSYIAGQYIDIILRDGRKRSFSIANAPHLCQSTGELQLHIRKVDNGHFTTQVFESLKEKAILRAQGPLGTFFVRSAENIDSTEIPAPLILMGGGTGFAPIKAIVEDLLFQQDNRMIHIYWGARAKKDLYQHALAQSWAELQPNIHYTPVLSEPADEDEWQGKTGWVHNAVCDDFADLSKFEAYLCGPPAMIDAGKQSFTKKGLAVEKIYTDSFDFATF